MEILEDQNVPEEYVSALRGDGHLVTYTRDISELGPRAHDDEIVTFAEATAQAVISTDETDFSDITADVPIFVAPQDMSGGDVRAAVSIAEELPGDLGAMEPIWLSGLV